MITVAAAADLHYGLDSTGVITPFLEDIKAHADLLLLAGDMTMYGDPAEAKVLAEEIGGFDLPVVAVLGNHDYHQGLQDAIRGILEGAGVQVIEGESAFVEVDGAEVAVAGVKGFCGGFAGACAAEFGEAEMRGFVAHSRQCAESLEHALASAQGQVKVALLHYSPVEETLRGERLEIYPFLGSYLLAEAIDRAGADVVFHGHAHAGAERGVTPGGIPVRNVAQPVIGHPYGLFRFGAGGLSELGEE
ncbi:MAG: metallophosphoesterase family protein [Actinomycetota bacterium]